MRTTFPKILSDGREREGFFKTGDSDGANGRYHLICPETGRRLLVLGSDGRDWKEEGLPGEPWEHVSVSLFGRSSCPAWPEMEWVRGLFWEEGETVLQISPPRSVKVNYHPGCLHLWRPTATVIPLPPTICVGPLDDGPRPS